MDLFETIHNHRSIRKFKSDPVPADVLEEILQAGLRASSSGNMNTYSIVVTQEQSLRDQLVKPHMQQEMVSQAPMLITFCADFNRMRKWLKINNAADSFDNYMSFMVAATDATLASQNVALAAEGKGLGICYLGSTFANCDQIGEVLQLPKSVVPVVGFVVGYADEDPKTRDRLPLDGIVHNEVYQDYSDARITEVYKDRDRDGWNRYMTFPRLRQKIENSGVENLAQIYSQLKYTKESHDKYSTQVLAYLKKQDYFNHPE